MQNFLEHLFWRTSSSSSNFEERLHLSNHCIMEMNIPVGISHRRCSVKKDISRNFKKFTGKHLCQSLVFNKVATLLKKKLRHRCFLANFVKFLRTPFYRKPSGYCFCPASTTFDLWKYLKINFLGSGQCKMDCLGFCNKSISLLDCKIFHNSDVQSYIEISHQKEMFIIGGK